MLIRLATTLDAAAVNAIYRPYVIDSVISFELEAPTDEQMAGRMAENLRQYPWLVCCSSERVLGYAYAGKYRERHAYQWAAETSVYVDQQHRRRGVGRALMRALMELLRRQGFYSCYAGITLPNPASIALHQAVGFTRIGTYQGAGFKHGAWHDVDWWQKPLGSYVPPVEAPKSMDSLRAANPQLDLFGQCA